MQRCGQDVLFKPLLLDTQTSTAVRDGVLALADPEVALGVHDEARVVGDHDNAAFVRLDPFYQRLDRLHVEVVGGPGSKTRDTAH